MIPFYRVLFAGAVASIPAEYRRVLGLKRPWWPAVTLTRVILGILRLLLGPSSTSEDAARIRIARLSATS